MLEKLFKLVKDDFEPPKELKVCVVGMPRGGTSYTANMLNQYVPAGHEHIFGNGRLNNPPLSRPKPIEVSGFAMPWVPLLKKHDVKIVQLIRDPLKCCTSFFNYFTAGQQHITWEDTCQTYFSVHTCLSYLADVFVHLERWREEITPVFDFFPNVKWGDFVEVDHSPSSWSEPKREWKELPKAVQEFGWRHGYGP